jgi:hypothetical protein
VKNSRIGPFELGNEEKCAGASPQLTPDIGWAIKKKKKKSTKKVAGVGFEPGGSGSIPTFGTFSVDRFFLSYIYPFKKKVLPFGRTFCS